MDPKYLAGLSMAAFLDRVPGLAFDRAAPETFVAIEPKGSPERLAAAEAKRARKAAKRLRDAGRLVLKEQNNG